MPDSRILFGKGITLCLFAKQSSPPDPRILFSKMQ